MYLVMALVGGLFFRDPPHDYDIPGYTGSAEADEDTAVQYRLGEALRTPQWYLLTAILTLDVAAGIAPISQASPALQTVTGIDATTAAGLVGVLAIFNGAGRVVWAWASDHLGRMQIFLVIFVLNAVAFAMLRFATTATIFAALAAIVYTNYGGGFGT